MHSGYFKKTKMVVYLKMKSRKLDANVSIS